MSEYNTGPPLGYSLIPPVLLLPCRFTIMAAKSQAGVGAHVRPNMELFLFNCVIEVATNCCNLRVERKYTIVTFVHLTHIITI